MFGLYRTDLLSTKLLSLSLSFHRERFSFLLFAFHILSISSPLLSFQSLFTFSSSPNYSTFITLSFLRHSFLKLLKFTPFLSCASIPSTKPFLLSTLKLSHLIPSDFLPASVNFFVPYSRFVCSCTASLQCAFFFIFLFFSRR